MTTAACPTCRGKGAILTVEFGGRTARPCPTCQTNPERARLAREFGSDRQRREIAAKRLRAEGARR